MPRAPHLTLVTFGFKYGTPNTNYTFDVSFLKNPAREEPWSLFDAPDAAMQRFVLDQPACRTLLDKLVPLVRVLLGFDDDLRIGIGCSAGRHRSRIVAAELARLLEGEGEGVRVRLIHREEVYA
jgi:RNase adaptor protein for sRNA GlmZ degradation